MLISRSIWRKLLATLVVVSAFVLLYEARILDSRFGLPQFGRGAEADPQPGIGATFQFSATAYCKGTTTASGVNVRSGIAAADPALLPVGSVIHVDAPGSRHDGVYTIMDTGPRVQGRHLDLYMWSCYEALAFGRTPVKIDVLRLGWSPQASTPTIIDRLFRRREAAAQKETPLPAEAERQIPASTLPDTGGEVEPIGAPVDPLPPPGPAPVPPLPAARAGQPTGHTGTTPAPVPPKAPPR
jgi:3D (Asp-Asp-Asp) domain-containing protein